MKFKRVRAWVQCRKMALQRLFFRQRLLSRLLYSNSARLSTTAERPLSLDERLKLLESMPEQLKGPIIEEPEWTKLEAAEDEDFMEVRFNTF